MKKPLPGWLLAAAGMAIMVIAALDYLTDWNISHPPFGLGLIFTAAGTAWAKYARR